ncbi:hypothetical protein [Hyphomicrobium sp. MC8b]|uniref:hypothetical protein n=1 Tax=Hyphomicrobium sp. MC8b TaxID=300273 RepID=UPI00391968BB
MTDTNRLTAQDIYDRVPLGARLAYSDGEPEPPKRFTRKHADWRRNNGTGMLISKAPPQTMPSYHLPGRFTLHEGNFGGTSGPLIVLHRTYLFTTSLHFHIISNPPAGSVQILQPLGDTPELLHLATNENEARAWLAANRYSDAYTVQVPEAA